MSKHNKIKTIYHIFTASNGNNVLYISSLYEALKEDFEQKVFVSWYSPVKNRNYKSWFHPLTDLFHFQKKSFVLRTFRYVLRYAEFAACLFFIYLKCVFSKPNYLNLSTASQLKIEFIFIKALKALKVKVIYTCHDAQPFKVSYKRMSEKTIQKFYNSFDYIIVHNKVSANFLISTYSIDPLKFLSFPFPPLDLKLLGQQYSISAANERRFLFIGHLRNEKGYDLLIEAWRNINEFEHDKKYYLTLAGNIDPILNFNYSSIETIKNFKIINKYLTDYEFVTLIAETDFVVLPYRIGTNSGILSASMSMGKIIICSDIPSLKTHNFVLADNLFEAENIKDLEKIIETSINSSNQIILDKKLNALKRFETYKADFKKHVLESFASLKEG